MHILHEPMLSSKQHCTDIYMLGIPCLKMALKCDSRMAYVTPSIILLISETAWWGLPCFDILKPCDDNAPGGIDQSKYHCICKDHKSEIHGDVQKLCKGEKAANP